MPGATKRSISDHGAVTSRDYPHLWKQCTWCFHLLKTMIAYSYPYSYQVSKLFNKFQGHAGSGFACHATLALWLVQVIVLTTHGWPRPSLEDRWPVMSSDVMWILGLRPHWGKPPVWIHQSVKFRPANMSFSKISLEWPPGNFSPQFGTSNSAWPQQSWQNSSYSRSPPSFSRFFGPWDTFCWPLEHSAPFFGHGGSGCCTHQGAHHRGCGSISGWK